MSENSGAEMQTVTHEGGTTIFPFGVQYYADKYGIDLIFVDNDGDVLVQTGSGEWLVVGDTPPSTSKVTPIK